MLPHAIAVLSVLLAGLALQKGAAPPAPLQLRYVANAGVLLTVDGRKLLIDAPIREGIRPYTVPSPPERALLEDARAPYDGVSAILITHWHDDHFSAEAVAAHLRANERTILVSSREVVARIRASAPDLPEARFRMATPDPGTARVVDVAGLRVHVLRIRHNPTRRLPAEHVGFLVQGTRTALHVGDADPAADNFNLLGSLPGVDLALVPYWFLTDAATASGVVTAVMKPKHTVGLHLPSADADSAARTLAGRGLRATLLRTAGEVFSFE